MELNNIPNDKDTTVITPGVTTVTTPMQEQIRNVPKTDVEPTTSEAKAEFQIGELPKGGFTKVYDDDIYESEDGKRQAIRRQFDEVSKVTVDDAKEKEFPIMKGADEAKPITLYDMKVVRDNATDQKVRDAWVEKMNKTSDKLKKKVYDVAKSFSKKGKGVFSNEDWTNLAYITEEGFKNDKGQNYYIAYVLSAYNSDDSTTSIDRMKKLGREYASTLKQGRATDSRDLRESSNKILSLLRDKNMEVYPALEYAFDQGRAEYNKAYEAAEEKLKEAKAKETEAKTVETKPATKEVKTTTEKPVTTETKAKPAAKVEKAKTTPKAAVETPVTSEVEEVKPKNAAEEKLEEKVKVSLSTADAIKDISTEAYESAQVATEELAKKAKKLNDGKDLMNNLPDFAINRLLRNEFGDLMVDKNGKKVLNSKALGTYGWFVLDNLGAALVNASLVARGMTPTQKSAYKQYLENEMLNAIGRKNKLTESINDIQLQGLVSDKELLTTIGTERIKLGSTEIDNALRAYQNDIDTARFAKLLNENAQYLSTLSDESKQEMLKFLALQAQDADTNARILGRMQASALKAQLAKTDTEKLIAEQQVKQGNLELKMKEKDIAKAEQALAIMKVELEKMYKNLEMTDLDMEKLKLAIERDTIDNKYLDAKNVMELVNDGSSAVGSIIKSIIPGI